MLQKDSNIFRHPQDEKSSRQISQFIFVELQCHWADTAKRKFVLQKKRRNLFPQFCSLCFGHFLCLNFTLKIIISAKNFYLKFHKNCINCHFGNFQIQNFLSYNSFLTKKNYLILSLKS